MFGTDSNAFSLHYYIIFVYVIVEGKKFIISKLDSMLSFYMLILLYIIIIIITALNMHFDKSQCVYSKFKTTISITTITIIIRLQELNLTN